MAFNFIAENKLFMIGQRIYSCANRAIIDKIVQTSIASEKERVLDNEISKLMHLDIEKLLLFRFKSSYVINNSMSILLKLFILIYLMSWVGAVGFVLLIINFGLFVCAFKQSDKLEE
jgi:hypothetical protein